MPIHIKKKFTYYGTLFFRRYLYYSIVLLHYYFGVLYTYTVHGHLEMVTFDTPLTRNCRELKRLLRIVCIFLNYYFRYSEPI